METVAFAFCALKQWGAIHSVAILVYFTFPEVIKASRDGCALARPFHIDWPPNGVLHVNKMQI